jgi:cysteinyl-tRNA synthetase
MYIYNSLTRKKEKFEPILPDVVTMYICGVTPYDEPHLGHAVTALRGSVLRNYLGHVGYRVTYVQNITDVDDKIINRARVEKLPFQEISQRYIESYHRQLASFGIEPPDHEPRVTDYIDKIIAFVTRLIEKDRAYVTEGGDVYYDVSKEPEYGCLSNQVQGEVLAGTRTETRDDKRHNSDFALWKRFDDQGETFDSPWGPGRPGWHIECSVMCTDIHGPVTDIHLGGLDLIFPHHENELAQCTAYFNRPFVKYWAHLGLLNIGGTKMSKSLGNFLTVDEALKKYGRELLIYTILSYHYRSPVNLSDALFEEHINTVLDWSLLVDVSTSLSNVGTEYVPSEISTAFDRAMQDDFNTPLALVALGQGFKKLRTLLNKQTPDSAQQGQIVNLGRELKKLGGVLHLFRDSYDQNLEQALKFRATKLGLESLTLNELEELYMRRQEARSEKNYALADEVRDVLEPYGITIMDGSKQRFRF